MAKIPEIAAPVATFEMCQAAVHNGADSVYVGFPGFNARAKTKTLTLQELHGIIEYCHLYGVKAAVCLNIVIYENELASLVHTLSEVIKLAPDSFVVQDLGVARLIKYLSPSQKIAASTQMTVTDGRALNLLSDLGFARYIPARELPFSEIAEIARNTDKEIEAFAHGALCISYSGQCLSSESNGGRSANRGQCAQSCRLKYELLKDGAAGGDEGYFLSPYDLCTLKHSARFREAGVAALKIEGRMKPPEYVAKAATAYKAAAAEGVSEEERIKLEQELSIIFSRGFSSGFLTGIDHKSFIHGGSSGHVGFKAGEIKTVETDSVTVSSQVLPTCGMGALFADFESDKRAGGKIFSVSALSKGLFRLGFSRDFPLGQLKPGMVLFINSCDTTDKELRKSWNEKERLKRIPVTAEVRGRAGEKLFISLMDGDGNKAQAQSNAGLIPAEKKSAALDPQNLNDELSKQGGGPFKLSKCEINLEDGLFLNRRELKEMRQSLSAALALKRKTRTKPDLRDLKDVLSWIDCERGLGPEEKADKLKVTLLLRNPGLLSCLKELPLSGVCLDFENPGLLSSSVDSVREAGFEAGVACPRITRVEDDAVLEQIALSGPDYVLVRSHGAFEYFLSKGIECRCDFSFNITNHLSARWLLSKGAKVIAPSFDLDAAQIRELVESSGAQNFEVPVYFHSPLFHTEHCLFTANFGNGHSFKDCGRPCEKHELKLKDPYGTLHIAKADPSCRNTLFREEPTSIIKDVPGLARLGLRRCRIEELGEDLQGLRAILGKLLKSAAAV